MSVAVGPGQPVAVPNSATIESHSAMRASSAVRAVAEARAHFAASSVGTPAERARLVLRIERVEAGATHDGSTEVRIDAVDVEDD